MALRTRAVAYARRVWKLQPLLRATLGIVGFATAVGAVATVEAHATLVRSDPPAGAILQIPPEQVRLWFNEPVEPGFSQAQVLNSQDQRVDRNDGRVLAEDPRSMLVSLEPLEPGVYQTVWKALSAVDGHVTEGTFHIAIGVEAPPARPPSLELPTQTPYEAAARWLGYVGLSALLGTLLFLLVVLEPAARQIGLAPASLTGSILTCRVLLWAGWGLVLAGTLGMGLAQFGAVGGTSVGALLFATRYGALWLARGALLLALGVVLVALARGWKWMRSLAVLLILGIVMSISLNSHSAAVNSAAALAVAADVAHQLAAYAWAGGLFSLALGLPPVLTALQTPERRRLLTAVAARFSALAGTSVTVLAVTGFYQGWLHIGSLGGLLETFYGQGLLVKQGLLAVLLAIAAVNLLVLRPRLAAGTVGEVLTSRPAMWFGRLVRAESLLILLVLLAAATMTSLPPARQTFEQLVASRPLVMNTRSNDLDLRLAVYPARPGPNTFSLELRDRTGQAVGEAEGVAIRFRYLDKAFEPTTEMVGHPEGGRYELQTAALGLEGRWLLETLVRRTGRDDARAVFRFQIMTNSARELAPPRGEQPLVALPALSPLSTAAFGVFVLALALLGYAVHSLGVRSLEGRVLTVTALLLLTLGVFLFRQAPSSQERAALQGTWSEVARWQGDAFLITEPFAVSDSWRIRWRLVTDEEPIIIMVTEPNGATVLETLVEQVGVTSGEFYQETPGRYALMFHNGTPYEAIIEQRAP